MDRQTRQLLVVVVIVVLVVVAALLRWVNSNNPPAPGGPAPTQPEERGPSPADSSIHLTMGNPSGATDDPARAENYLMRKPYFALSYNNAKGTPNWVSWCLKKADLGSAPRGDFYPDTTLPRGFKQVKPSDYSGSGFDRGHMCPAADRNRPESADATFVMTNIIPQSPHCNQRLGRPGRLLSATWSGRNIRRSTLSPVPRARAARAVRGERRSSAARRRSPCRRTAGK